MSMASCCRAALFAAVLVCTSCMNGVITPNERGLDGAFITSIVGTVVDERGYPMSGVTVTAHGQSTHSDDNGTYSFRNISVLSGRVCVIATMEGYFTSARAEWPSRSGATIVPLSMQKGDAYRSIDATAGGSITVEGATVTFPKNAFATSTGAPYNGAVTVIAAYLTPDSATTFARYFPGDALGQRTDRSYAELTSYGVLRIRLASEANGTLRLREGVVASIRYPVPATQASAQPPTIPMWYFDEGLGVWVEEGQATLQGSAYVGTVGHFTDWNLDISTAEFAFVEGTVRCDGGRAVGRAMVNIGQLVAFTDDSGHFRQRVAANRPFTVELKKNKYDGISSAPIKVSSIAPFATHRVDISVHQCSTILEGTLVDCSNNPIAGLISAEWDGGIMSVSTVDGYFQLNMPKDTPITILALSIEGLSANEVKLNGIPAGSISSLGSIQACIGTKQSYSDVKIGAEAIDDLTCISRGTTIAVLNQSSVRIYDVTSGSLQRTIHIDDGVKYYGMGARVMFNDGATRMLVAGAYMASRVYDVASGSLLVTIPAALDGYMTNDGSTIIAIDEKGKISTFDAVSGVKRKTLTLDPSGDVDVIGLQNGGAQVIVSIDSKPVSKVVVWDVATDRSTVELTNSNVASRWRALSPDGTVIGIQRLNVYNGSGAMDWYSLTTGALINEPTPNGDSLQMDPFGGEILLNNEEYVSIIIGSSFPYKVKIRPEAIIAFLAIPGMSMYAGFYGHCTVGAKLAIAYEHKISRQKIIRVYD